MENPQFTETVGVERRPVCRQIDPSPTDSCHMDSIDSQEIIDAIERLRSSIESLEMRVSSLEGSVGRSSSPSTGGIEQKLDQISRSVNAIRKEMF